MKFFVWGCVILGVLSGAALLLSPRGGLTRSQLNERNAAASLKTVVYAQLDYRENDRDGDQVRGFWRRDISGLYSVLPAGSGEMIRLIDLGLAGADAAPAGKGVLGDVGPGQVAPEQFAVFAPKAGYLYLALRHANEAPAKLDLQRFAACAYPATYPASGRATFIVSEAGAVYKRDLGRPGPPDVFPDDDTLKREWSMLD